MASLPAALALLFLASSLGATPAVGPAPAPVVPEPGDAVVAPVQGDGLLARLKDEREAILAALREEAAPTGLAGTEAVLLPLASFVDDHVRAVLTGDQSMLGPTLDEYFDGKLALRLIELGAGAGLLATARDRLADWIAVEIDLLIAQPELMESIAPSWGKEHLQ